MLCSDCNESVHGRTEIETLGGNKAHLRYLRGTITYGLGYTSNGGLFLHGYGDVDWAGSRVDWKSTFGYYFSLGSAMISWSSKKQGSIVQSIAEAEYIAASDASKEAVWLRKLVFGCLVTSSRQRWFTVIIKVA
jgi:hypothetical protein